jgi:hypothetical protein
LHASPQTLFRSRGKAALAGQFAHHGKRTGTPSKHERWGSGQIIGRRRMDIPKALG